MSTPTLNELQAAWTRQRAQTNHEASGVAVRLLADGRPVTPAALAAATGWSADQVARYVENARRTGVEVEDGAIVGMALTLRPTAHRFRVRGNDLYTWCGFDALFLPIMLREPAEVTSTCPVTGAEIRLRVAADGSVSAATPATVVVGVVGEEVTSCCSVAGPDSAICTQMPLFASREAGERWLADHPGVAVVDLDQARTIALAYAEPSPSGPLPAGTGASGAEYDLLVVGAGSAAFAAAITAAEAGRTVALVQSGTLGGTCVNVGCVPSKALLAAGEAAWTAARHPFGGVPHASGPVDAAALVAAKDQLVAELRQTKYAELVDMYGFEVIPGRARFVDPATVEVAGRRITAGAYLIATGASPAAPPVPGLADAGYLTSATALDLKELPPRLAVLGANAVGLELGQYFLHLGVDVTFIDIADRIAPQEEPEVSEALTAVLADQGARVLTGARLRTVRRLGQVRVLNLEVGGEAVTVAAEELLVATGRSPNTADLGLDTAGVAVDERGAVTVDVGLRTSNPRVWAAGDVTGAPQLVYVAAYHGRLAAQNALLEAGLRGDYTGLPRVIFTAPQLAAAGPTEAQARAAGFEVKVATLPLSELPRALVARDTRGLVKLVADTTSDRLLGASVVGPGAGDVIQSAVLAIRHQLTTAELAATFHPYLTMAEGLRLAAQSFTRDVAHLSCCA